MVGVSRESGQQGQIELFREHEFGGMTGFRLYQAEKSIGHLRIAKIATVVALCGLVTAIGIVWYGRRAAPVSARSGRDVWPNRLRHGRPLRKRVHGHQACTIGDGPRQDDRCRERGSQSCLARERRRLRRTARRRCAYANSWRDLPSCHCVAPGGDRQPPPRGAARPDRPHTLARHAQRGARTADAHRAWRGLHHFILQYTKAAASFFLKDEEGRRPSRHFTGACAALAASVEWIAASPATRRFFKVDLTPRQAQRRGSSRTSSRTASCFATRSRTSPLATSAAARGWSRARRSRPFGRRRHSS